MSITRTSPAQAPPSPMYSPGLGRVKVIVALARTASPRTSPVSAWTPEGISQATTGQDRPFIRRMAVRKGPSAGRVRPMPKRASTMQSQVDSQVVIFCCSKLSVSARLSWLVISMVKSSSTPPEAASLSSIALALGVILTRSPTRNTRT